MNLGALLIMKKRIKKYLINTCIVVYSIFLFSWILYFLLLVWFGFGMGGFYYPENDFPGKMINLLIKVFPYLPG